MKFCSLSKSSPRLLLEKSIHALTVIAQTHRRTKDPTWTLVFANSITIEQLQRRQSPLPLPPPRTSLPILPIQSLPFVSMGSHLTVVEKELISVASVHWLARTGARVRSVRKPIEQSEEESLVSDRWSLLDRKGDQAIVRMLCKMCDNNIST